MKRNLIKLISALTIGAGALCAIPVITTSCNTPTSKVTDFGVENKYVRDLMPEMIFVKGISINWACDLCKHIVDKDGKLINDTDKIGITCENLPTGLTFTYDKAHKNIRIKGVCNEIIKEDLIFDITYSESSQTLKLACNFEVQQEVDFPEAWLQADTTTVGALKTSGQLSLGTIQKEFLKCNTLRIPIRAYNGSSYVDLTSIGNDCFADASTKKAKIPDNAHIHVVFDDGEGSDASKITNIGVEAFMFCSGVKSVQFPKSLTTIADSAFQGCSKLTSISFPNKLTSIGRKAFAECRDICSVNIVDNITTLTDEAFLDCWGIEEFRIGSGTTTIGTNMLKESPITDLSVDENNTKIGFTGNLGPKAKVVLDKDSTTGQVPDFTSTSTSDETSKARGCMACGEIDLSGITGKSLLANAFSGCCGITSIIIPTGFTINGFAFYSCSGIDEIHFKGTFEEFKQLTFGNYWIGGRTLPHYGTIYAKTAKDAQDIKNWLLTEGLKDKKITRLGIEDWYCAANPENL